MTMTISVTTVVTDQVLALRLKHDDNKYIATIYLDEEPVEVDYLGVMIDASTTSVENFVESTSSQHDMREYISLALDISEKQASEILAKFLVDIKKEQEMHAWSKERAKLETAYEAGITGITVPMEFDGNEYSLRTTPVLGGWQSTLFMDDKGLITVSHKQPLYELEKIRDNELAKRIMTKFGKTRHEKFLKPIHDMVELADGKRDDIDTLFSTAQSILTNNKEKSAEMEAEIVEHLKLYKVSENPAENLNMAKIFVTENLKTEPQATAEYIITYEVCDYFKLDSKDIKPLKELHKAVLAKVKEEAVKVENERKEADIKAKEEARKVEIARIEEDAKSEKARKV
jgi:hypothetical protein